MGEGASELEQQIEDRMIALAARLVEDFNWTLEDLCAAIEGAC